MKFAGETLLVFAFALALAIFWRLHVSRIQNGKKVADAPTPGALQLGQFAVPADKRWLLIRPDQ